GWMARPGKLPRIPRYSDHLRIGIDREPPGMGPAACRRYRPFADPRSDVEHALAPFQARQGNHTQAERSACALDQREPFLPGHCGAGHVAGRFPSTVAGSFPALMIQATANAAISQPPT